MSNIDLANLTEKVNVQAMDHEAASAVDFDEKIEALVRAYCRRRQDRDGISFGTIYGAADAAIAAAMAVLHPSNPNHLDLANLTEKVNVQAMDHEAASAVDFDEKIEALVRAYCRRRQDRDGISFGTIYGAADAAIAAAMAVLHPKSV